MKFVVFGSKGQLGREFCRVFEKDNINFEGYDLPEIDISDNIIIDKLISNSRPNVIINCASFNDVGRAETDYNSAYKTNVLGVSNLAVCCKLHNIKFVHYSTDYVFDGNKKELYTEDDVPNPLNNYGKSKLECEQFVVNNLSNYLLFRLSWLYGDGKQNFMYKILNLIKNRDSISVSDDEFSIPTSTRLAAEITILALKNNLTGLFHLVNTGAASRYEWIKELFEIKNINKPLIKAKMNDFNSPVKRPQFSALSNEKISKALNIAIPSWKEELNKFFVNFDYII